MPKLITIKIGRMSEKGSALIAVVMLSLVVTVAGVGYLQFMANTVHNEVKVLDDAESFQAVESGLVLGCSWLELGTGANYHNVLNLAGGAVQSNVIPGLVVNGYTVTVNVRNDTGKVAILATANSSSVIGYNFNLSANLTLSSLTSGAWGVYTRNLLNTGKWNNWINNGFCYQWFDGPLRFNTAIRLFSTSFGNCPTFYGPVVLTNIDPGTGQPVVNSAYGTGHNCNDYTKGITVAYGNPSASNFDQIFLSTFRLAVPTESLCLNSQTVTTINLSSSSSKKYCTFGVSGGIPYYKYYNTSGTLKTVQYSATAATILYIAGSAVSDSGTVMGNVTLYTDPGYPITVCGNIKYADYTPKSSLTMADSVTNFGVGFTSQNVLALVSGGDIIINNSSANLVITAQLHACCGDTSSFEFISSNHTVTLIGCQGQSVLWCGKSGNSNIGSSFQYFWDRRQPCGAGLGYIGKGSNGNLFYCVGLSKWCCKKQ